MTLAELFGGSITMKLPDTFLNASQFRQVPDSQEVFIDANNLDSLIVEILESTQEIFPGQDFENRLRYHWDDLCTVNESQKHEIIRIFHIKDLNDKTWIVLLGLQVSGKSKSSSIDVIYVLVAFLPLDEVSSDILITNNIVLEENCKNIQESYEKYKKFLEYADKHLSLFRSMIQSFDIKDVSLFGE